MGHPVDAIEKVMRKQKTENYIPRQMMSYLLRSVKPFQRYVQKASRRSARARTPLEAREAENFFGARTKNDI